MLTIARPFKAIQFAAIAHHGQVRKYTGEPYIVHPIEVAGIVASVTHDEEMLDVAALHDVIEDTKFTFEDIQTEFGTDVAVGVWYLTDDSTPEMGNRDFRKNRYLLKVKGAPSKIQTVKLADLISNTKSIVQHDPKFAAVYLKEKTALLEVLTGGDTVLWNKANEMVKVGLKYLETIAN